MQNVKENKTLKTIQYFYKNNIQSEVKRKCYFLKKEI